jgi:hypothetical protein
MQRQIELGYVALEVPEPDWAGLCPRQDASAGERRRRSQPPIYDAGSIAPHRRWEE